MPRGQVGSVALSTANGRVNATRLTAAYRVAGICASIRRGFPSSRCRTGRTSICRARWCWPLCARRAWPWSATRTGRRTLVRVPANNRKCRCSLVTSFRTLVNEMKVKKNKNFLTTKSKMWLQKHVKIMINKMM